MSLTRLDRSHLVGTVERLRARIRERFPTAGLLGVADELAAIVDRHAARSARIARPTWRLRALSCVLLLGAAALVVWLGVRIGLGDRPAGWNWSDTLQTFEAGLSMLFFLGAGAIYVASLELRTRRRRCLQALHELRALAHIVDMHQLTKDPDLALRHGPPTESSPERTLTPFLLTRYLDYCTEVLSLIGKVGALYAQDFPDPQAVAAVDDIESLTTGLSQKIWQKIMILASHATTEARHA